MLEPKLAELAALVERFTGQDGVHPTAIAPLCLYRYSTSSPQYQGIYEPGLCIIAQGSKLVMLGGETYRYDRARFLLVSVDLPVVSQVIDSSPESPYLSLKIDLDPGQIGDLLMDLGPSQTQDVPLGRGMAVGPIEFPLLDAVVRLLHLLDNPRDIGILAPLALREITYRLLMGEEGARLRQIAAEDGQAQRIATAIRWIKRNFAQPFRIEALAREVHMSSSGLHHHFKAVTAMSPLQYQKQLRLQEARRLMLSEALDAAAAGYRVGYESPSQFSREYRRFFGEPPQRDLKSLRKAVQPLELK
ncbi:AraC family transcriptional regulator [Singulisphaera sp. Ch08]|uniref:AraC family transcriptional regulator n=1 Tax=Singulisphaera sp. Ch08 TaxID=3120278 RepID=A0AAU7CCH0_9BACT